MTPTDIQKCETFNFIKYQNQELIQNLINQKEQKFSELEKQQKVIQLIKFKWGEVQRIASDLMERQQQIQEQNKEIESIKQTLQLKKIQVWKYQQFQDLEHLKDEILVSKYSFHGLSQNYKLEESELKEVIAKLSKLNQHPTVKQCLDVWPLQKNRLNLLQKKEEQLMKDNLTLKYDLFEQEKKEFERKKEEIKQNYEQLQRQREQQFLLNKEEIENEVKNLKVDNIPDLETQRGIKKQIEGEISALESWIARNKEQYEIEKQKNNN